MPQGNWRWSLLLNCWRVHRNPKWVAVIIVWAMHDCWQMRPTFGGHYSTVRRCSLAFSCRNSTVCRCIRTVSGCYATVCRCGRPIGGLHWTLLNCSWVPFPALPCNRKVVTPLPIPSPPPFLAPFPVFPLPTFQSPTMSAHGNQRGESRHPLRWGRAPLPGQVHKEGHTRFQAPHISTWGRMGRGKEGGQATDKTGVAFAHSGCSRRSTNQRVIRTSSEHQARS